MTVSRPVGVVTSWRINVIITGQKNREKYGKTMLETSMETSA